MIFRARDIVMLNRPHRVGMGWGPERQGVAPAGFVGIIVEEPFPDDARVMWLSEDGFLHEVTHDSHVDPEYLDLVHRPAYPRGGKE